MIDTGTQSKPPDPFNVMKRQVAADGGTIRWTAVKINAGKIYSETAERSVGPNEPAFYHAIVEKSARSGAEIEYDPAPPNRQLTIPETREILEATIRFAIAHYQAADRPEARFVGLIIKNAPSKARSALVGFALDIVGKAEKSSQIPAVIRAIFNGATAAAKNGSPPQFSEELAAHVPKALSILSDLAFARACHGPRLRDGDNKPLNLSDAPKVIESIAERMEGRLSVLDAMTALDALNLSLQFGLFAELRNELREQPDPALGAAEAVIGTIIQVVQAIPESNRHTSEDLDELVRQCLGHSPHTQLTAAAQAKAAQEDNQPYLDLFQMEHRAQLKCGTPAPRRVLTLLRLQFS